MKDLNYFVFGRDNEVSSTILIGNKIQNKIFVGGDKLSTNVLKEVNRILDIVAEDETNCLATIYINEAIYKTLQRGSYKRWVQSGLYPSGDQVEEDYLNELKTFMENYPKVFTRVTILPHNMCGSDITRKGASYTWAQLKGKQEVSKSA